MNCQYNPFSLCGFAHAVLLKDFIGKFAVIKNANRIETGQKQEGKLHGLQKGGDSVRINCFLAYIMGNSKGNNNLAS